jgi:PAS domain S-box-containing protein
MGQGLFSIFGKYLMEHTSTVLIVDDQPSAREVLRGSLLGQGYNLVFASTGQEALTKATELGPDLILLDVMMPGMDGFEVCRHLRTDPVLVEVPIIMITALDDQASRLRGLEAGADDFVSKPFDRTELRARVRAITRLNRYRRLLLERTYRQQAEEAVERHHYELTLLNWVLTTAASTLQIPNILSLACESLAQAFEMPHATAWWFNETRTEFVDVVDYTAPGTALFDQPLGQKDTLSETIPLTELLPDYLAVCKTPLVIVDEQPDPRLAQFYHLMREYGVGAMFIIPVCIGDQVAGLIELEAPERRDFNERDLTLAHSIAIAIGQAMETAQLYQGLQAHAASLEQAAAQRTRELQRERDRAHAVLESVGDAVIVTDVAGTIQYLNPAAVALTGFIEEEAIGQNWRLWQSRKSRERDSLGTGDLLSDEILRVVRTGQIWQGEISNKRRDGAFYETMATVTPLFDPDQPDQLTGFVSVFSDITALKETARARQMHQERDKQIALDRLRHTFLSTVNHELRTPLSLIIQCLEMLEDPELGELNPRQLDALMALRRQSWTLSQMIEGLTRVAAFLSKQETVKPVLASLEPVFSSVLPLAEFKSRRKEITVETNIAPNLPILPLDVKQMDEALAQLVDNAIKFNKVGGQIKISAHADESWVIIMVADTGSGIEEEVMSRLWEVFEQGVDPLRRAQEGLGLGLVLARYIIEAHHGVIEIQTTLGQGSTFTVKLPLK